jgi:hypothetical protein
MKFELIQAKQEVEKQYPYLAMGKTFDTRTKNLIPDGNLYYVMASDYGVKIGGFGGDRPNFGYLDEGVVVRVKKGDVIKCV